MNKITGLSASNPLGTDTETKETELIDFAKLKLDESYSVSNTPKIMKAEILSTERALIKVLEQVKSDPALIKKVTEGLDPNDSLHALALELLSEDLTSSRIILSDEKKAEEWFSKISADNIKVLSQQDLLSLSQHKKKEPWRLYHIVTVPAKGIYTLGKYTYKGYRFISNLALPLAVGAIVLQSPWLPILKLLLGKVL